MSEGESRRELAAAVDAVLAPPFLQQLDRLRLHLTGGRTLREGENRVRVGAHAAGLEVESHREYDPSDDLRRIDWNVYARLDELVVRMFRPEREAPHYLFVDCSGSMGVPPQDRKLAFGASLAAALSYVAIRNRDPVRVLALGAAWPKGLQVSPVVRHLQQAPRLRQFLVELAAGGETVLSAALESWLQTHPAPGVVTVISDFLLPPTAYQRAIAAIAAQRFSVACVRVLGGGERDPSSYFRAGRIVDAETGAERELSFDAENQRRYQRALQQHLDDLTSFCARLGIACVVADCSAALDTALVRRLRRTP